jgi:hypothetical protein
MDPGVKHWLGLWDYLDGNFWGVCRWAEVSLSPEQVAWQPVPAVASIGWNMHHLGEMLDYYMVRVFGRGEPMQAEPWETMRPGSRDDGRHHDVEAIARYHRRVRPAYREFLAGLTAADLDRVIERTGRWPITYAWAVGHIAEHESYHVGKCTLLRSLLAARNAPTSQ